MNAFASQLAQVQEQMQVLPGLVSTVGRLSSENRALKDELADVTTTVGHLATDNARLSTDNVRLSSEVKELRSSTENNRAILGLHEQERQPGGRWLRDANGIWTWSLATFSTSVLDPVPSQAFVNFATATDLPVELLDDIVALLPRQDRLRFGRTCFRALEVVAPTLYSAGVTLDLFNSERYILNRRESHKYRRSPRISALLRTDNIALGPTPRSLPRIEPLFSNNDRQPHHLLSTFQWAVAPEIEVTHLSLTLAATHAKDDLAAWGWVLSSFDPVEFSLISPRPMDSGPLVRKIIVQSMVFPCWNRLEAVVHRGGGSVLAQRLDTWREDEEVACLVFTPGRRTRKGRREKGWANPEGLELSIWTQADGGDWVWRGVRSDQSFASQWADEEPDDDVVAVKLTRPPYELL